MLEALETVQARLKGDPVDWYKGFFSGGGATHKNEEDCRNELIKMFMSVDLSFDYTPESHVADDKRVDIVVQAKSDIILPIEIKGQWHRELWTAADKQLDHLYCNDWRAEYGIYLVLWFGVNQTLKNPPKGIEKPTNPQELQDALTAHSKAAKEGRVTVVVLDFTRPTPC